MGSFNALQTATIRDFSGGLNVITDDLNMDSSYSTIETNVFNNINGTKSIRYGTRLFKKIERTHVIYTRQSNPVYATDTTSYYYKFKQNSSNRVPVGAYINIFDSNDSETATLLLAGIVSVTSEGYFYVRSYTTNYNFTSDQTVYMDFYKLDILQEKVEVQFSTKSTQNGVILSTIDVPELQYMSIGQRIYLTSANGNTTGVIKSINNGNYYLQTTNNNAANMPVDVEFYINDITGTKFIDGYYFLDKLILVTNKGEVCAVDGAGNLTVIFNNTIANSINSGNQQGWNDVDSVCFATFNGILTIWNEGNKPLAVDLLNQSNIYCNYLIDPVTMNNQFVPYAKYAIGFNHYLVAGNIYDELEGRQVTDRLCISAKDSIGTFYSGLSTDADNDAVNIDLGTIISNNSLVIKGLSRYRNQLAVGFDDATVFGTLGDYIETQELINGDVVTRRTHNPKFDDVIDKHGCISNRTYMGMCASLICLDYGGISNFSRRNIAASVLPSRISELVAPDMYKYYTNLTEKEIEDRVFCVNNPKENQYLLFIPNSVYGISVGNNSRIKYYTKIPGTLNTRVSYGTVLYSDKECKNYAMTVTNIGSYYYKAVYEDEVCYAYTLRSKTSNIKDGAWSKFIGWNFDFGITTALNTVFLGKGLKLYTLGSIDDPIYADYVGDEDYPAENEEDTTGKAIEFTWEFPWADFGDRAAIKKSRYIALSTTGKAYFTVDMFIDYIYTNKEFGTLDPCLSMNFIAGDGYGYGDGNDFTTVSDNIVPDVQGKQYYGGSRRTNTEFLFAWTTKFKIAKFRISGSSKFKLNINSLTIYYQKGNIRR